MPGTAPTGWQTPKTNWSANDPITTADLNRFEGNPNAIETGSRTIDPTQVPSSNQGTLRQFLDWIPGAIKRLLGTTNWYDTPPTTLAAAKSHIDAAAPHSGHETPTGAQTKVDAHANLTAAHSATSDATANRIIVRDAAGRAKVAAPVAADDIARKDTIDSKFDPNTGHKHTGAAGDAPLLTTYVIHYAPSDVLCYSNDAEVSYNFVSSDPGPAYAVKALVATNAGRFRFRVDLRTTDAAVKAVANIWVGDVRVAHFETTSTTYQTFTDDMTTEFCIPYSRIALCIGVLASPAYAYVRNFRIYASPVQQPFAV